MLQNYKIFIKDTYLLITGPEQQELPKGIRTLDTRLLEKGFSAFLEKIFRSNDMQPWLLQTEEPEKAIEAIRQQMKPVTAAGGIVWNRNMELLMIFRRGKWDLPKGKVEENESMETAALREVEEESGVGKLRLLHKFCSTYHIYMESGDWVLKETVWFEMTSQDEGRLIPQSEEGILEAEWVKRHEIHGKLENTYPSILELVEHILRSGYAVL